MLTAPADTKDLFKQTMEEVASRFDFKHVTAAEFDESAALNLFPLIEYFKTNDYMIVYLISRTLVLERAEHFVALN